MIDPTAKLSVSRQAVVLGISRSSVCYQPRPIPAGDLPKADGFLVFAHAQAPTAAFHVSPDI